MYLDNCKIDSQYAVFPSLSLSLFVYFSFIWGRLYSGFYFMVLGWIIPLRVESLLTRTVPPGLGTAA